MAGCGGCRSKSWLAVRPGLKLKLGWELEWELESELELKLQPELELEWELEPRPLKLGRCDRTSQNPDFSPKCHHLANSKRQTTFWGRFWGYISKTENVAIAPGDPAIQSPLFNLFYNEKCIFKEP